MSKQSITEISHLILKYIVSPNDVVIDATVGHGFDTLFLSGLCRQVYGFDIQQEAIDSTNQKLNFNNIQNVKLILDSHENYASYIRKFNGALFNLGYLPQGDKSITTQKESTLSTIRSMLDNVEDSGYLIIVVYPGHEMGKSEDIALSEYLSTLNPKHYKMIKTYLPFQDNHPPYIWWITKTKKPSQ